MVQRVILQPSLVRVSPPGIDVMSASEPQLLLSLGLRNMQILQRGFKTPDVTATPPGYLTGEADYTFYINIPNQQSIADFWCNYINGAAQDRNSYNEASKPNYTYTFTSNQITVVAKRVSSLGDNPRGISYMVLRKRIDS